MTESLFPHNPLDQAVAALRNDLLAEGGPQISTMLNYRFAILPYRPSDEFKLRRKMRVLADELMAEGWSVLTISLQKLLLDRIRQEGGDAVAAIVAREKRLAARDPRRALDYLADRIVDLIEGPDGLAADVVRLIGAFADANQDADRTLVLLGRTGALYPFSRSSALLKHIDGKTRNLPVVLLYPGEAQGGTALSFMGELKTDRDYRPRIYS